jgi:antitoxin VapB
MVLSIKHPAADKVARELARRTGKSITEAVIGALESELEREKRRVRRGGLADRLLAIGQRYAALPLQDRRSDEEILGFDERGMPR